MEPIDFRDRWVLVTGASAGLGQEMAKQLARRHGANVIAVARRRDRLVELQQEIEGTTRSRVLPIAADLSSLDETDRVLREAMDGRDVHAAVLNAGITHFGDDAELSWDGFRNMLDVNVTSVMRMVRTLIPHVETRSPGGGVLLVSSMAGLTPVPYQSAYSATKAFLVNYGLSMTAELEGRPVSLTVFAPGGIQTEMTSGERFRALGGWLMPVEPAAEAALEGLRRREFLSVPGAFMRTGTSLLGLIPRRFLTRQVGAVYRRGLARARGAGG